MKGQLFLVLLFFVDYEFSASLHCWNFNNVLVSNCIDKKIIPIALIARAKVLIM